MRLFQTLIAAIALCLAFTTGASAGSVKLTGNHMEMDVPSGWAPGYKDLDDKMLMVYFKNPKTDTTLEGVYLRKVQGPEFTLEDFKKWRIAAEGKRYDGKDFKVDKEGTLTIGGEQGNYIHSTWKDGGKLYEKHTAQFLKDGGQYMVVLHGVKGKVNKAVFDHAVKTFGLGK